MDAGLYHVVIVTAPNTAEARKISETLVGEGLAACVNIIESCQSIYRWKGELVADSEVLMLAKTRRSKFEEIEKRVSELHSYDVPEIIAVDLSCVARGYAGFLEDVLAK